MSATAPNPRPERASGAGERIPYLRAMGDLQPKPKGEVPTRPQLRAVDGRQAQPGDPPSVKGPSPTPRPRFLGLPLPLWLALAASIGFYVAVQYYLHSRGHAAVEVSSSVELIPTASPQSAIPAGQLWLRWTEVEGAESYQLHIQDAHGGPVADPLTVYGSVWNPPDDLLPGLVDGSYVWTIEAMDENGESIARSAPNGFTIGN